MIALCLLLWWETYARLYGIVNPAMRPQSALVTQQTQRAQNAARAPAAASRIAILGSSQLDDVKREAVPSPNRTELQLAAILRARGVELEIVNRSAPGQQVFEMMATLVGFWDAAPPTAVVVGAGMFSMQTLEPRPRIRALFETELVHDAILAAGLDSAMTRQLLALAASSPPRTDSTVQERSDARIRDWLELRLSSMANRRKMFNEMIDTPVRRDFTAYLRKRRGEKTARTFGVGPAYAPSLAALEVMAHYCATKGIPLYVVALPIDYSRSPAPETLDLHARYMADLRRLSHARGFTLVDLVGLLGREHFDDFQDGSPDGLHYDARGHRVVADTIAALIAPALTAPRR